MPFVSESRVVTLSSKDVGMSEAAAGEGSESSGFEVGNGGMIGKLG